MLPEKCAVPVMREGLLSGLGPSVELTVCLELGTPGSAQGHSRPGVATSLEISFTALLGLFMLF